MKNLIRLTIQKGGVITALLCLFYTFSCQRHEEPQPQDKTGQPVSIQEARNWFENEMKTSLLLQDTSASTGYFKSKPVWSIATNNSFRSGLPYVQIPLQFDQNTKRWATYPKKTSDKTQNGSRDVLPDPQLIIFKNDQGKFVYQVMELIPDQQYYLDHQGFTSKEDYSGLLMLKNWTGKLEDGFQYENGKVTGRIKLPSQNTRTQYTVCENYITYYFTASCNEMGIFTVHGTRVTVRAGEPANPGPVVFGEDYYCTSWMPNGTDHFSICRETGGGDTGGGGGPDPNSGLTALRELSINSKALFGPCPGLTDNWRNLISFKPPQIVKDRLLQLSQNEAFMHSLKRPNFTQPDSWFVQAIGEAKGIQVNLDNFSVFMDDLPIMDGRRMSINEFVNYIRLNLNTHVDATISTFTPHPRTGVDEAAKWQSSNPLGTVMSIGILGDPGSVIVTEFAPGYEYSGWTFSTIHDPLNGNHPVSGTRVFGCYETANGYIFYTQGADRLTGYGQAFVGIVSRAALGQELQFTAADKLWRSLQTKVAAFVNSHGAHATIRNPITNRPNWLKVKEAMEKNSSLSTVPCN